MKGDEIKSINLLPVQASKKQKETNFQYFFILRFAGSCMFLFDLIYIFFLVLGIFIYFILININFQ